MAQFNVGRIPFSISPVSIMKCWTSIGWSASANPEAIREFQTFTREIFSFLFNQDSEMDFEEFCEKSVNQIDEIAITHDLRTEFMAQFMRRLRGRFDYDRTYYIRLARQYTDLVAEWLNSPVGKCGARAVEHLENWRLSPTYASLGAIGSFGNAVFGRYVPTLRAVCVQLDVVATSSAPELQFLETLLHEEIHAVIHREMGDNERRAELTWLNELCAVLTSQHALMMAGRELLMPEAFERMQQCLSLMRRNQQYGGLAEAVLRDTNDPLIAWKAWQRIFTLSPDEKRNYAKRNIITPILQDLGCAIRFPYRYGGKQVTVFV